MGESKEELKSLLMNTDIDLKLLRLLFSVRHPEYLIYNDFYLIFQTKSVIIFLIL